MKLVIAISVLGFGIAGLASGQAGAGASRNEPALARDSRKDWSPYKERVPNHPVESEIENYADVGRFDADKRDLFKEMDKTPTGPSGSLESLRFDYGIERDRFAMYGRNTWLLWCGGNER